MRTPAGSVSTSTTAAPLEVDELLVAAGRKPNTDQLGLAAVGLSDGGPVRTDDAMCAEGVEGRWLYAVGDVTGRAPLTHMGKYQGRIAGDVIAARAAGKDGSDSPSPWTAWSATADHGAIPQVVFTDPEVAAVGRTEAAARDQGLAVDVRELDVSHVPGASLYADGYTGRAKLVVDTARNVVVGATFVGPGRRRADPLGDRRGRGRGAAGAALACGPQLSDDQRAVAQAPGGLRHVNRLYRVADRRGMSGGTLRLNQELAGCAMCPRVSQQPSRTTVRLEPRCAPRREATIAPGEHPDPPMHGRPEGISVPPLDPVHRNGRRRRVTPTARGTTSGCGRPCRAPGVRRRSCALCPAARISVSRRRSVAAGRRRPRSRSWSGPSAGSKGISRRRSGGDWRC